MQHFYLHVALSLKISTYYILKYFFAETVGHIMRAVFQGNIWIETVNPIPGKKYDNYHLLILTESAHYENLPIQIYWKVNHRKNENFQTKNSNIFHISAQNIDCGYSLEPPRRGGSNEYPQSMFWAEIRKIMYTPVNPSFTI